MSGMRLVWSSLSGLRHGVSQMETSWQWIVDTPFIKLHPKGKGAFKAPSPSVEVCNVVRNANAAGSRANETLDKGSPFLHFGTEMIQFRDGLYSQRPLLHSTGTVVHERNKKRVRKNKNNKSINKNQCVPVIKSYFFVVCSSRAPSRQTWEELGKIGFPSWRPPQPPLKMRPCRRHGPKRMCE